MRVHPEFRAIFTSNPEEYAGVHKTQDALLNRMITIVLDYYDRETEVAITRARADIDQQSAEKIVDLVRELRMPGLTTQPPTLRASVMIARVMRQLQMNFDNPLFLDICFDVLRPTGVRDQNKTWIAAGERIRSEIRSQKEGESNAATGIST